LEADAMVIRKDVSDIGWEVGPVRALRRHLNLTRPEFVREDEFNESEVRELFVNIFSNTNKELLLSTDLDPDFYNDQDIQESMRNVSNEKDVDIRILLDARVDAEERRKQVPWISDLENVDIRQSKKDIPHWLISDGRDVRLEKPHNPNQKGAPYLVVRDLDPTVADVLDQRFNTWWSENSYRIDW
jgi:hypothetical protein